MRYALAALLFMGTAALADEPRKIDFTVILLDADDQPLSECLDIPPVTECKSKRPVTLGAVAMRALSLPEQNLAPEESLKRGQLAISVYRATAAQLTAEEIALIKKQIAKAYGPLIVARSVPLLDPASVK